MKKLRLGPRSVYTEPRQLNTQTKKKMTNRFPQGKHKNMTYSCDTCKKPIETREDSISHFDTNLCKSCADIGKEKCHACGATLPDGYPLSYCDGCGDRGYRSLEPDTYAALV